MFIYLNLIFIPICTAAMVTTNSTFIVAVNAIALTLNMVAVAVRIS